MVPGNKEYTPTQLLMKNMIHVILTQMSAYAGIKKHGEAAIAAIFKELKQLDSGPMKGKPVVTPMNPDLLTKEEKAQALEAVNLIKEKRDGMLKGRTCANGKKTA